jgi:lactoylglutathione lyase
MSFVRYLIVSLIASALWAQTTLHPPRTFGIAHAAVYVSDLEKARSFYRGFLGFDEPFSLKHPDGTDWIAVMKINDEQYLELFAGNSKNSGHLSHFAIYTDDAVRMRDYLLSRGVRGLERLHKGQTGNYFFTVKDPDNHLIEIVEYHRDSLTGRAKGNFMSASRASSHLMHVGIRVGAIGPAMTFYRDILGFQEFGRGSDSSGQLSWIDMRVPNGSDYVEFMLSRASPSPELLKTQNHLCLASPDVQKSVADLQSRRAANLAPLQISIQLGDNQPRRASLFDPDGTRIEIMEPVTINGTPLTALDAPLQ